MFENISIRKKLKHIIDTCTDYYHMLLRNAQNVGTKFGTEDMTAVGSGKNIS